MNTTALHHDDEATTTGLTGGTDSTSVPQATSSAIRWLSLGTVIGPVLFTLAWIILGGLRPGYSPISQPISALGIGPHGNWMDAAFVLNGVLCILGVIAIFQALKESLGSFSRWICTGLLALSPLGILWAGLFPMNHLSLHTIGTYLALRSLIIVYVLVGLFLRRVVRLRHFGTWMLAGSPLTLALLVGFTFSVPHAALISGLGGGSYGLWERALVIEGQAWYVLLGWLTFRRP